MERDARSRRYSQSFVSHPSIPEMSKCTAQRPRASLLNEIFLDSLGWMSNQSKMRMTWVLERSSLYDRRPHAHQLCSPSLNINSEPALIGGLYPSKMERAISSASMVMRKRWGGRDQGKSIVDFDDDGIGAEDSEGCEKERPKGNGVLETPYRVDVTVRYAYSRS